MIREPEFHRPWRMWYVVWLCNCNSNCKCNSSSTSVNIDRLTVVDNTSAVGNDSRPWVVPQSIKWLSTITRERRIPPDSESGGIPHLFGTFLSPHIGSCLTCSTWQQRQQLMAACLAFSIKYNLPLSDILEWQDSNHYSQPATRSTESGIE